MIPRMKQKFSIHEFVRSEYIILVLIVIVIKTSRTSSEIDYPQTSLRGEASTNALCFSLILP